MVVVNADLFCSGYELLLAAATPDPAASPTAVEVAREIDPNRVTPGMWGFLSFLALILACVAIYFSLRKQLKRVNFDEDAPPAGTRDVDVFPIRLPSEKTTQDERPGAGPAANGSDSMRSTGSLPPAG